MANNSGNGAGDLPKLKETLVKLAELRETRDELKDQAERAQLAYKRHEAVAAEQLQDAGLSSVKIDGLGLFNVQSRMFVKVEDLTAVMKWATEAGLLTDVVIREDGRVVVPFETTTEVDAETGRSSLVLVNGILKGKPYAKPISDHSKQVLESTDQLPEGVALSTSTFITWRRQK